MNHDPLPSVAETYLRLTGIDPRSSTIHPAAHTVAVKCVSSENHRHGDASASLHIHLDKDVWVCRVCTDAGKQKGGQSLDLVVHAGRARDRSEAAKWLCPPKPKRTRRPPVNERRIVARYEYQDENRTLLYEVIRYEWDVREDDGTTWVDKTFSMRAPLPDGRWTNTVDGVPRVPYRYPEMMLLARTEARTLYVLEGEKDVDKALSVGLAATTNAGGASWAWTAEFLACFQGVQKVVVIGDNDDAGRAAAIRRADLLAGVVGEVRLIEAIPGIKKAGDVSDFFAAGGTVNELLAIVGREVKQSDAGSPVSIVDWSEVRIEPILWLLRDRVPLGEFTIIEGEGGIGKTTAVLDLIARLSQGIAMPDGTLHLPACSLIVAEEDRKSVLKARLLAAGANLAKVALVEGVGDDRHYFTLPADTAAIVDKARSLGAKVVLIDALFNHFDDDVNANKSQDVRKALRPTIEASHVLGAAFVGIRHWAKTRGPASERGLGSIDLRNIARSVITVATHPTEDDRYLAAVSKSNLGARSDAMSYKLVKTTVVEDGESVDVARVEWGLDVAITANELASAAVPNAEERTQTEVAGDFVVDFLADGPRPSAEVYDAAKQQGFKHTTVFNAARLRRVNMTRSGHRARSTWALPDESSTTHSESTLPQTAERPNDSQSVSQSFIQSGSPARDERKELTDDVSFPEPRPMVAGPGTLSSVAESGDRPPEQAILHPTLAESDLGSVIPMMADESDGPRPVPYAGEGETSPAYVLRYARWRLPRRRA